MVTIRVTFVPNNTTVEFISVTQACKALGINDNKLYRWLLPGYDCPPYLKLERIERPDRRIK